MEKYRPYANHAVTQYTAKINDRVYVLNYFYGLVTEAEIKERVRELYAEDLERELSEKHSPTSPMARSPPSPGIFVMDIDKATTKK